MGKKEYFCWRYKRKLKETAKEKKKNGNDNNRIRETANKANNRRSQKKRNLIRFRAAVVFYLLPKICDRSLLKQDRMMISITHIYVFVTCSVHALDSIFIYGDFKFTNNNYRGNIKILYFHFIVFFFLFLHSISSVYR